MPMKQSGISALWNPTLHLRESSWTGRKFETTLPLLLLQQTTKCNKQRNTQILWNQTIGKSSWNISKLRQLTSSWDDVFFKVTIIMIVIINRHCPHSLSLRCAGRPDRRRSRSVVDISFSLNKTSGGIFRFFFIFCLMKDSSFFSTHSTKCRPQNWCWIFQISFYDFVQSKTPFHLSR